MSDKKVLNQVYHKLSPESATVVQIDIGQSSIYIATVYIYHSSLKRIFYRETQHILYASMFVSLLILSAAAVFWLRVAERVSASARFTEGMPTDGWLVCEDLGVGPVPGVDGDVQRWLACACLLH